MNKATVTMLPTAAAEPVVNPRWHGRYPSSVISIPHRLRAVVVGGFAVVTQGPNRGLLCQVTKVDPPGRGNREADFLCMSLGRKFHSLRYVSSGEPAPDSIEAHVRRSWLRPVPTPKKQECQSYSMPAWPARWDQNLKSTRGGGQ